MQRFAIAILGLVAIATPCLAIPSGLQRPFGGYPMDYMRSEPGDEDRGRYTVSGTAVGDRRGKARSGRVDEDRPYALTGHAYDENRGWSVRTERFGSKVEREIFVRP